MCIREVFGTSTPPVSEQNSSPPTLHHQKPDFIPNTGRSARLRVAMNNAFGFGGINSTVLLRSFV